MRRGLAGPCKAARAASTGQPIAWPFTVGNREKPPARGGGSLEAGVACPGEQGWVRLMAAACLACICQCPAPPSPGIKWVLNACLLRGARQRGPPGGSIQLLGAASVTPVRNLTHDNLQRGEPPWGPGSCGGWGPLRSPLAQSPAACPDQPQPAGPGAIPLHIAALPRQGLPGARSQGSRPHYFLCPGCPRRP